MDNITHDLFKPEAWLVRHDEPVHGIAVRDALRRHSPGEPVPASEAIHCPQCVPLDIVLSDFRDVEPRVSSEAAA